MIQIAFVDVPDPRAETVLELDFVSKVSSHVGNACCAGMSEPPLKHPRADQPTGSIDRKPFDRRNTQRVYASDVSRTRCSRSKPGGNTREAAFGTRRAALLDSHGRFTGRHGPKWPRPGGTDRPRGGAEITKPQAEDDQGTTQKYQNTDTGEEGNEVENAHRTPLNASRHHRLPWNDRRRRSLIGVIGSLADPRPWVPD